VTLHHSNGLAESFEALHSYNDLQIRWFKAGSALNFLKVREEGSSDRVKADGSSQHEEYFK